MWGSIHAFSRPMGPLSEGTRNPLAWVLRSPQVQGGLVPSVHTTVVRLSGGTTTVVCDAGGAGLLLLMQPDSAGTMMNNAATNFIMNPPSEN